MDASEIRVFSVEFDFFVVAQEYTISPARLPTTRPTTHSSNNRDRVLPSSIIKQGTTIHEVSLSVSHPLLLVCLLSNTPPHPCSVSLSHSPTPTTTFPLPPTLDLSPRTTTTFSPLLVTRLDSRSSRPRHDHTIACALCSRDSHFSPPLTTVSHKNCCFVTSINYTALKIATSKTKKRRKKRPRKKKAPLCIDRCARTSVHISSK